jgi:hypothetical protein
MWVAFLSAAVLIGFFVARIRAALNERGRALVEARRVADPPTLIDVTAVVRDAVDALPPGAASRVWMHIEADAPSPGAGAARRRRTGLDNAPEERPRCVPVRRVREDRRHHIDIRGRLLRARSRPRNDDVDARAPVSRSSRRKRPAAGSVRVCSSRARSSGDGPVR